MRIVVAMSGGVDSSTVAALLHEQGHEVIGVHMKLHDTPSTAGGDGKHCCGYDDALDARNVADQLGIPFYVMNLREAFQKAVVDNFVDAYKNGLTPNPCVNCNGVLKFDILLKRAIALGAEKLATGHYARIEDGHLRSALDPAKDQSYFLWPIKPAAMEKTLFPLGGMTKPEVREHAARLGLVTADKPESQEVCFIPDDNHARLVQEMNPDLDGTGTIVDEEGKVLGHHDGYFRYTVGQRRGLGIALGKPAYVLRVEPESRQVVVGFDDRLQHLGLVAAGGSFSDRPDPSRRVFVRIRHRGGLVPCFIGPGARFDVRFDEPARAVSPGQSAVFYAEDRETVLGGATIVRALEVQPELQLSAP